MPVCISSAVRPEGIAYLVCAIVSAVAGLVGMVAFLIKRRWGWALVAPLVPGMSLAGDSLMGWDNVLQVVGWVYTPGYRRLAVVLAVFEALVCLFVAFVAVAVKRVQPEVPAASRPVDARPSVRKTR